MPMLFRAIEPNASDMDPLTGLIKSQKSELSKTMNKKFVNIFEFDVILFKDVSDEHLLILN